MVAIHTAGGIHISAAHRPHVRSAHLPDPAFRHGYVGSTRADWRSTCAILSSSTSTLDLQDLVRITDLSPAPMHGSMLRVAYHGAPGAYSEAAAAKAYPDCDAIPCDQFEVAFLAVELWIAYRAVLPVENSLGGSMPASTTSASATISTSSARSSASTPSSPSASTSLSRTSMTLLPQLSTSPPTPSDTAAIASARAADLYNLQILVDGIQDVDSGNVTRFVMLAREPVVPRTDRPFTTSIVFAHDREGTSLLHKVLSAFAFRDISLTKIESRQHRNRPIRLVDDADVGTAKHFEYIFDLDFQASLAEPRAQSALAVIQEFTSFLRVLGSYPMDMTPWGASASPSSSAAD